MSVEFVNNVTENQVKTANSVVITHLKLLKNEKLLPSNGEKLIKIKLFKLPNNIIKRIDLSLNSINN